MSETEKRKTSADILKDINAMKDSVKNGSLPLTAAVVAEINASESTPDVKPTAESKPEPAKAAETVTAESVDLKEWAKKKGYDETEESVLRVLRKAEQVFHERQAQRKAKEQLEKQNIPPMPLYAPSVNQNGYNAPSYSQNPRQLVEQLARENNMTVEDFERVAKVASEMSEAKLTVERQRWQREFDEVRKGEQKNSVFRELSSDPVLRHPQVQYEYNNVLEQMQASDPQAFEKDPGMYKAALDRALQNISRRNLEGQQLEEGVPPRVRVTPPMTPPKPLGQRSGGGYQENENAIDPQAFAKLSVQDKAKVLEGMGLRTQYQ